MIIVFSVCIILAVSVEVDVGEHDMKLEIIMKFGDAFFKEYSLQNCNHVEILKALKESNYQFEKVSINEDVEGDMKSVSGTYIIEKVIEKYDYYMELAAREGETTLSAYGKHGPDRLVVQLYRRDSNTVMLSTKDEALELGDIINV